MRSNVTYLYPSARAEFSIPLDAGPADRFQPIRVCDDSLNSIGIYRADLLAANLSLKPRQGQFSFFRTSQDFLLGYYFETVDGRVKVENLCPYPCCPPDFFESAEILVAAPIVRLYRSQRGMTCNFAFQESRGEMWTTRAGSCTRLRAV